MPNFIVGHIYWRELIINILNFQDIPFFNPQDSILLHGKETPQHTQSHGGCGSFGKEMEYIGLLPTDWSRISLCH